MKAGRLMGIIFFFVGVLLLLINFFSITSSRTYFPSWLAGGAFLVVASLGLIIKPGIDATIEEINADRFFAVLWNESTQTDKIVWIAFVLLGIATAGGVFSYFELSL